jgi:hypothetical protein
MQGNGSSGGDLNEIRLILAEIATGQARHEHMIAQLEVQFEQNARRHSEMIASIDERLDRAARHLEVHSILIDDLIRNKQDRKKRA